MIIFRAVTSSVGNVSGNGYTSLTYDLPSVDGYTFYPINATTSYSGLAVAQITNSNIVVHNMTANAINSQSAVITCMGVKTI